MTKWSVVEWKIDVLDKIKKQRAKATLQQLQSFLGVSKSTISWLRANEVAICEEWQKKNEGGQLGQRKRKHEGKYPDVDEALNLWFSNVSWIQVDGLVLKVKAESIAKENGSQ